MRAHSARADVVYVYFFVRVYITFCLIAETSTIESVVFNDNAID